MYTWKIKIILHNGKEIEGIYQSNKANSTEACYEFLGTNVNQGSYSVMRGLTDNSIIFVKTLEIDSIEFDF